MSSWLLRICSFCSQPYQPEPALLRLVPEEVRAVAEFRRGSGCAECLQTGFSGRFAVTELLVPDEVFRDAVLLNNFFKRCFGSLADFKE